MNIFQHLLSTILPEERKASGTHPLIALQHAGAPVWSSRQYATLTRVGFERNVVAYRCIRMIAEAAASVPLEVQDGAGSLCEHALIGLIDQPNPDQSGAELFEEVFGYLQAGGNAYIEAVRIEGEVRELYALRPDRVKIIPDSGGWPGAYEYEVAGRKVTFRRGSDGFLPILHLKLFHPASDQYGFAPLEAAAMAVDIHNAACIWNKSLLDNAARPSGAIVYEGLEAGSTLTVEQFDRLKEELADGWQGQRNAGRPMVLDGGLDWKQMSLSPTDMDFIEAKHSAARDIALAFGVPPQLLGIPGDNTYANYREANLAFWRQTVLPLAGKLAAALTGWLCTDGASTRVAFDAARVDALSPERGQRLTQILAADFLTEQEKRIALGFPAHAERDQ